MREITLQPGACIEIDGVIVRAAKPLVAEFASGGMVYDPATGLMVSEAQEETESRSLHSPLGAAKATPLQPNLALRVEGL
ncbi:hypothetical protein ACMHYJ_14205 [Castellaniella hirudinis]|uniref:hypothetical protein n=1 Tax=Castellaniella hirudinis TaxID=1144617 RepID=UPI0039C00913